MKRWFAKSSPPTLLGKEYHRIADVLLAASSDLIDVDIYEAPDALNELSKAGLFEPVRNLVQLAVATSLIPKSGEVAQRSLELFAFTIDRQCTEVSEASQPLLCLRAISGGCNNLSSSA
jgi:hypothetical protein